MVKQPIDNLLYKQVSFCRMGTRLALRLSKSKSLVWTLLCIKTQPISPLP